MSPQIGISTCPLISISAHVLRL